MQASFIFTYHVHFCTLWLGEKSHQNDLCLITCKYTQCNDWYKRQQMIHDCMVKKLYHRKYHDSGMSCEAGTL